MPALPFDSNLQKGDWLRLRALRDRFLTGVSADYWREARDVELYDRVFAQRIRWKWEAVLESVTLAGWKPASERILDWGCGSGIASRTVAEWSGIRRVGLFDQSQLAQSFAGTRLREMGIEVGRHPASDPVPRGTLLVISHVAGELDPGGVVKLAEFAGTAEELLWVEPGSHEHSRKLGGVREILQKAGHRFLAPCTHQNICPMLEAANERHWCHFFARPPVEIFQSQFWREASRQLEIDLRSLPYSFLASTSLEGANRFEGAERLIGRPVELKANCKLLCCGADGLMDRTLQRRDAPELFRLMTKKGVTGVFAWAKDPDKPGRVNGGEVVG